MQTKFYPAQRIPNPACRKIFYNCCTCGKVINPNKSNLLPILPIGVISQVPVCQEHYRKEIIDDIANLEAKLP